MEAIELKTRGLSQGNETPGFAYVINQRNKESAHFEWRILKKII